MIEDDGRYFGRERFTGAFGPTFHGAAYHPCRFWGQARVFSKQSSSIYHPKVKICLKAFTTKEGKITQLINKIKSKAHVQTFDC